MTPTDLEKRDGLTPREQEIIGLIVRGWTTKQIALWLGVSFTTAKTHIGNIHSKAGTTTRLRLVVWAPKRAA